jgi:hypothetical protein
MRFPAAARAFADAHSIDELYLAVARFAVLAYAPSMHAKRAVMAVRAAHAFRDFDLIVECARYAARSRPPWSEPPILEDAPDVSREELERDAGDDALLMIDTAFALIPIPGGEGEGGFAAHASSWSCAAPTRSPSLPLEVLVDRAIASRGRWRTSRASWSSPVERRALSPPRLSPKAGGLEPAAHKPPDLRPRRDFAQTLLAHARPPFYRRDEFLAAVQHNLEHGEDFSDFA